MRGQPQALGQRVPIWAGKRGHRPRHDSDPGSGTTPAAAPESLLAAAGGSRRESTFRYHACLVRKGNISKCCDGRMRREW